MPRPDRPSIDFWASVPHLFSLSAWRMHLRTRPWGWLSHVNEWCAGQVADLPPEYELAFAEEYAFKKTRPWLQKP
ncbi:hypothetical protein [Deinococcus marmoris]|uniref:Uncharacterized protein n=1 Tax=Deinococcus marmoris TaxID=249408 RepID=A0A1U7P4X1_9DEIO|nr:hypothetical protein [Deinococcus marmoris]OLV20209.1 hypothetical protein BOO71_0000655 [Deinococcus marmoris]